MGEPWGSPPLVLLVSFFISFSSVSVVKFLHSFRGGLYKIQISSLIFFAAALYLVVDYHFAGEFAKGIRLTKNGKNPYKYISVERTYILFLVDFYTFILEHWRLVQNYNHTSSLYPLVLLLSVVKPAIFYFYTLKIKIVLALECLPLDCCTSSNAVLLSNFIHAMNSTNTYHLLTTHIFNIYNKTQINKHCKYLALFLPE